MNVALVDVDSRSGFPNLALMKLTAYHKQRGDIIEWYSPLFSRPDRIYASKIFTYTPDYLDYAPTAPEPIKGGTGYDPAIKLPEEIENLSPDYSLYPDFNAALGFITRGCCNFCNFCIVPRKEGGIHVVSDIERIAAGRKNVVLLDNNFLAAPRAFVVEQLEKIINLKLGIDFNQGLDARLVTDHYARLLARCKWNPYIRFSCDSSAMIEPVKRAVTMLRSYRPKLKIFCYLLVRDIGDAEKRLKVLVKMDITPFAQPYRDFTPQAETTSEQRSFARFVNIKGGKLCKRLDFKDYKSRGYKHESNTYFNAN